MLSHNEAKIISNAKEPINTKCHTPGRLTIHKETLLQLMETNDRMQKNQLLSIQALI